MRVGVTAPPPGDRRIARAVSSRRHSPCLLPCVAIEPAPDDVLAEAREVAAAADLVLLTSARVVDVVWKGTGMHGLEVMAVGPATADTARSAGATVRHVGEEGLADLVARVGQAEAVIAFPHADLADPSAADPLGDVVGVAVYRTTPVAPPPDPVDAVLFAAPSAVDGWHLSRTLDDLLVGAIGPTTAAAITSRGARPIVAAEPSFAALAATVPKGP